MIWDQIWPEGTGLAMLDNDTVLGDVTVLDLSEGVSGPLCTRLLADLGAQVLKVERPGSGEGSRSAGPLLPNGAAQSQSALFLSLNQSKKSVTLNLETKVGAQLLKQLAQEHDILVESFPPGHLGGLGLDYPALAQVNPGLIYTSITPFGQTGCASRRRSNQSASTRTPDRSAQPQLTARCVARGPPALHRRRSPDGRRSRRLR